MFDNFYFFYPFLAYSVDYHRRQNSASIMEKSSIMLALITRI